MSKSESRNGYGAWGNYRKQRELTKDFTNWKHEALEELKVSEIDSVYIIINEWSPDDSQEDLSEVVGGKFFTTEDEAWDDLSAIAEAFGSDIDPQDMSFDVPSTKLVGLSHDTYYIQELNR